MDYKLLSDQELLFLFNACDQKAYSEIYERYIEFLYLYAYKCLENDQDARDLIHDVFLSLSKRIGNLQVNGALVVYLYSCVSNAVASRKRHQVVTKAYRRYKQSIPESVRSLYDEKYLKELIEREIMGLGPTMRSIIKCNVAGVPLREIASIHRIKLNTVKSYIFQGRRILREKLGNTLTSG